MATDGSIPSRSVLITCCGSGIGRATALYLARRGWKVWATARKLAGLEELRQAGCNVLSLDVTDEASRKAAVAAVEEADGAVGSLVNNAGYSQSGAIEAVPMDRVRAQFETNVFGLVRLTQLVLPGMRRAGTAISDALRFEVKGFGIEVVVIEPGLIRSGFAGAVEAGMAGLPDGGVYAGFHEAVARASVESYEKGPLSKLAGTPEDVAAVVERALSARRPRPRYTVSGSARLLLAQKRLLSDRGWDAF